MIFGGLVVIWARAILRPHFKESWLGFFGSWFAATMAIAIVSAFAVAAIIYSHRFFVGEGYKDNGEKSFFYTAMTLVVTTIVLTLAHSAGPTDWDADPF